MTVEPLGKETREMTRAAAQWLALVAAGDVSQADLARLQAWRNRYPGHEQAWQRALQLQARFSGLPPALAMASLDRPDLGRRKAIKRGFAMAALLPTGWLLSRQLPVEAWRADLQTATGEQQHLTLADGSLLQLNTDTAVNLDLAANRLTLVRGELALKAARSSALTVQLPQGGVRLVQGELCARLEAAHCRISALDGELQLWSAGGATQRLLPGQQVNLTTSGFTALSSFDVGVPGWREGVLVADDQPLGDFLRELRRYRPGLLRWEPALEGLRITGSFRLDDTDRVLSLLAASLPLQVLSRTRYWVTLVPQEKNT